MARKNKQHSRPQQSSTPAPANDKPVPETLRHPDVVRLMHVKVIPGIVFRRATSQSIAEWANADAYAHDVIERMAPRDPVEEMLVAQLLFAHARVMRLTELANQQTELKALRTVHEYADRASNTYRRLMLALAEYRRPPRCGDTFAVVKQANIASQQVIQNHEQRAPNTTNEQGFSPVPGNTDPQPTGSTALPADIGRIDLASIIGRASQAVETVDRPTHT